MTSVVFMGTPAFSAPILRMLHEEGYQVLAVVTQPDRPVGRKKVLTPPPVKEEAVRLGLPVIQPEKLRGSEELQQIISLGADIIITAAFGQILPKSCWRRRDLAVSMSTHHFCHNIVGVLRFTKQSSMVRIRPV